MEGDDIILRGGGGRADNNKGDNDDEDGINNNEEEEEEEEDMGDMVMPGFRFHPTEEELVEFYLRRKVEGKRFNVELITFLDLYRYDPWELPALAAIGEKEWFFYVPRDRKYRNGDRPNRVTTSGYWKATGADRMIRGSGEKSTSSSSSNIGLKKTLVFYSGKAPKGIRTSWIMNEYRLPHHDTQRYQKATEISLCRVYKRPGVEDHPSLPRCLLTNTTTPPPPHPLPNRTNNKMVMMRSTRSTTTAAGDTTTEASSSTSTSDYVPTPLGLSNHIAANNISLVSSDHHHLHHQHQQQQHQQGLGLMMMMNQQQQQQQQGDPPPPPHLASTNNLVIPTDNCSTTSATTSTTAALLDDLHRLVTYQHQQQQHYYNYDHLHHQQQSVIPSLPLTLPMSVPVPLQPQLPLGGSSLNGAAAFWEYWTSSSSSNNSLQDHHHHHHHPNTFK